MDAAAHLRHLRADAAALLAAYRADPAAPVPSCPGWDRTALLAHTGGAHAWVRAQVEQGPGERVRFRTVEPPPEGDELPGWFESGAARLAAALEDMDTSITWPSFAGPQPGTFFPRRMALETAVHRWDADGAPIDAALAVDGVDEHLALFAPRLPVERLAGIAGTIHLHATDVDGDGDGDEGEWLISLTPEGITFEHGHAKGDVAVRGSVSDLLLWVWNRVPADDRFEIFGDHDRLERWRTTVVF